MEKLNVPSRREAVIAARYAEYVLSPAHRHTLAELGGENHTIPTAVTESIDEILIVSSGEATDEASFASNLKIVTGLRQLEDSSFKNAFTRTIRDMELFNPIPYSDKEPPLGERALRRTNEMILRTDSEVESADELLSKGIDLIKGRIESERSAGSLVGPENVATLGHLVHKRLPRSNKHQTVEITELDNERYKELFEEWVELFSFTTAKVSLNRIGIGNVSKLLPVLTKLGLDAKITPILTRDLLMNMDEINNITKRIVINSVAGSRGINLPSSFGTVFEMLDAHDEAYETSRDAVGSIKALSKIEPDFIGDHVYAEVFQKTIAFVNTLNDGDLLAALVAGCEIGANNQASDDVFEMADTFVETMWIEFIRRSHLIGNVDLAQKVARRIASFRKKR